MRVLSEQEIREIMANLIDREGTLNDICISVFDVLCRAGEPVTSGNNDYAQAVEFLNSKVKDISVEKSDSVTFTMENGKRIVMTAVWED